MSTNITLVYTPATPSLTYFASNVTGATWTLTNTDTPDRLAHTVSIRNDSATDHSGKTAIIIGTDANGKSQTEVIALPGASATVESTLFFKTLVSVTPSASIGASTMDIGFTDTFASQILPLDWRAINNITVFSFTVTGTINYTLQNTVYDVQAIEPNSIVWQNTEDPYMVSATIDAIRSYYAPVKAIRIIINSYSAGATLTFNCIGNG